MTGELQVPFDEEAERIVVGCAIASHAGYRHASMAVRFEDFYKPAHRALFRSCEQLRELDRSDVDTLEQRILTAARLALVPTAEVRSLVDDRPVMWDRSGSYAARVRHAALDRLLMSRASQLYNALAAGDHDTADAALRELQEREVA